MQDVLLPTACQHSLLCAVLAVVLRHACASIAACAHVHNDVLALVCFEHAVMTVTKLAKNTSACITQPGCGYKPDGIASDCRKGTYSSGNHKQPCTPCPSGLTTTSTRAESIGACMAPPGFFFQVGFTATAATVQLCSDRCDMLAASLTNVLPGMKKVQHAVAKQGTL